MLIDIWEHLRGYDKWVEVTARFEAADLQKTAHVDRAGNVSYTYGSLDTIVWTDTMGTAHSADFKVPDDSPIYQMIDGDKITICYDPSQPDRFYYRDLLVSRLNTAVKRALWTIGFAVFIAACMWLRFKLR